MSRRSLHSLVVASLCLTLGIPAVHGQDEHGQDAHGQEGDEAEAQEAKAVELPETLFEESPVGTEPALGFERYEPEFEPSYFYDGGVVPFVYGSLALTLGLKLFAEEAETPRLFPESEGGAEFKGDTVPSAWVVVWASASPFVIGGLGESRRWHHVKGYAQAVLTTLALTEVAKLSFGRHRPHYPTGEEPDIRRSFFSGHSSMSTSSTVYLGLFAHHHLLPKLRNPMLKALSYAGFATVAIGVPATRVFDNRHHLSDVVTGGLVGATTALLFYRYQEQRFLDEEERFFESLRLTPDPANRGLALSGTF